MTRILAQEDAARQLAVERSRQLSEWVLSTFNSGSSETLSLSALSSTDSFLLTVEPCFAWSFFAGRRRPCLPLLPPCAGGAPPRAIVDRAARRLLAAAWPRLARALGREAPAGRLAGAPRAGPPERPAASREGGWRRGPLGPARGAGEAARLAGGCCPRRRRRGAGRPEGAGAEKPQGSRRARPGRGGAGALKPAPAPRAGPRPGRAGGAGSRWGPKLGALGLWRLAAAKRSA